MATAHVRSAVAICTILHLRANAAFVQSTVSPTVALYGVALYGVAKSVLQPDNDSCHVVAANTLGLTWVRRQARI